MEPRPRAVKATQPVERQGIPDFFFFFNLSPFLLLSLFLSFLFSDPYFSLLPFCFICHSSSRGCKLVAGEPNSAHNWVLFGPQGGFFPLIIFLLLLTLNNHETSFLKNLDFELYLKNRVSGEAGPHSCKAAIS